ncbi:MAG: PCRF domain-containing protein, partial [Gemmatimonadetes bacterium]|nr:PCRF domain-containing protein [Gemmatimonadota bacterium]
MNWEARVPELKRRFEELSERLADPSVLADRDGYRKVAREHAELQPVVETATALARGRSALQEARALIAAGEDAELVELAEAEAAVLSALVARLESELGEQLLPKDPLADRE